MTLNLEELEGVLNLIEEAKRCGYNASREVEDRLKRADKTIAEQNAILNALTEENASLLKDKARLDALATQTAVRWHDSSESWFQWTGSMSLTLCERLDEYFHLNGKEENDATDA